VIDTALKEGLLFRVAIGGRRIVIGGQGAAMKCHRWLYDRGVRVSLKVEHRLMKPRVMVLTADGGL
jgi:hypothetical protein